MNPTRRDFIAGIIAALALCFAPLERFVNGLERLLAVVYAAPKSKLYNWKEVEVWINGQRFAACNEIVWNVS